MQANQRCVDLAEELVKRHMADYDPSHDWYHVNRVRNTALSLARSLEEPVDLLVVELAALFHDLTDAKYTIQASPTTTLSILDDFFNHPITRSILPDPFISSSSQGSVICRIVDNTSWSKEQKLRKLGEWEDGWRERCWELKCVQDADRLDAIGGFGILRCAAYSAAVNRPLHVRSEIEHTIPGGSAIQQFHDRLFKIDESSLKTPLGQRLAIKRQKLMREFVDAVEEESNID
ncbi:HD/PDEase domain [Phaffia rhodozyma]|uniref:HD/PDEase domain n=1 Tax=Phaffia rhodozyma TaxID=264483 RepID=A0A0F7SPE1_PHARH|nr:HD/PDEase domain [Phaffia rhodozyma]